MQTKQQIKNFLSENIVCVLVTQTMILLFLKVLLFLVVYPTVYSTRFIFENWYKWFPRKYDPRKDIKEGVDFRNTPQQVRKEFLLDLIKPLRNSRKRRRKWPSRRQLMKPWPKWKPRLRRLVKRLKMMSRK